ncbi:MAG: helix-turn-helix transcriptional regulator [Tyzzerella sp.]|nr:helix-turn-helix transcriptional regulator [Tyzzerella sp.]
MSNDIFLTNMGMRISQRRKELLLTQEQLAEKMGVSLQTISCIELGKKAIRPENLANLCTHLNVTADYILYGKRDEQQMNDITEKLSALSPDEYSIIQNLVDFLSNRK